MKRGLCFCIFISVAYPASITSFLLQNAPAAITNLATSASAYASSPPEQPKTHIANLLKKQQKAEQLQSEKLLVEDIDGHLSAEVPNQNDNEAAPSLLQKKLGKILTKLRFISSLTAASSGSGGESDVSGDGSPDDGTSNSVTEGNDTANATVDTTVLTSNNSEETTTRRVSTFQKLIYPHSNHGPPLMVSFDVNERIVNRPPPTEDCVEQSQKIQEGEGAGKLGQIGVFFAEIVGSIVALLYGAAAHITSGEMNGE